jgi:hypothetical protein
LACFVIGPDQPLHTFFASQHQKPDVDEGFRVTLSG